jgi:hypothetical protein
VNDSAGPGDIRHPPAPAVEPLPPYLVAGNRFGSAAFGLGLSGFLLSLVSFAQVVAWPLAVTAVPLGVTGFAKYANGGATNRDTSVVGLALGWVATLVLLARLSVALGVPLSAYRP